MTEGVTVPVTAGTDGPPPGGPRPAGVGPIALAPPTTACASFPGPALFRPARGHPWPIAVPLDTRLPPPVPSRPQGHAEVTMEVEGGSAGSARLGALLRARREELGLSQEDVAIAVGEQGGSLSRSTLSRIENGKTLPELRDAVILCHVLGIRVGRVAELVVHGEPPPPAEAADPGALVREGEALAGTGAVRAARERLERAAGILEGRGDDADWRLLSRAILGACWCLLQDRAWDRAWELASRVVNDPRCRPADRLRALAFEVHCLTELGYAEEARVLAAVVGDEVTGPAADSPALAGFVLGILGDHDKQLHRFEEAARRFHAAADAWTRARNPLELARARSLEAWCLLRAGRLEDADAPLAEALTVARELAPSALPEARFVVAAALRARGDAAGAAAAATETARVARETGNERLEFLCLHLARSALREAGRTREARELIGRLDHLARSLAATLDEARDYLAERADDREARGEDER